MSPMLQATGIKVTYGPVEAVKDVSFRIGEGSIVSLIGPNGTGKSTILNALSGLAPLLFICPDPG